MVPGEVLGDTDLKLSLGHGTGESTDIFLAVGNVWLGGAATGPQDV